MLRKILGGLASRDTFNNEDGFVVGNEPQITLVPRDLYYHEVAYVRRLEEVARVAREVSKWADGTTIDRLCAAVRALDEAS